MPPLLGQSPTPRWLLCALPQRWLAMLTLTLAQLQAPFAGTECRYVQPPPGLFRPLQYLRRSEGDRREVRVSEPTGALRG